MTAATRPRASVWDTKRAVLNSESELEKALKEYHEAEEEAEGDGTDAEERQDEPDRRGRIYAQNLEIDRAMVNLGAQYPSLHRLLHSYYREATRWSERRGWIPPAKAFGLMVPRCPGPVRCVIPGDDRFELETCRSGQACHTMHDTWLVQLTLATKALLRAIQGR